MKVCFINLTIDIDKQLAGKYLHPRHKLPPIDVGYCISAVEDMGHTAMFMDSSVEELSFKKIAGRLSEEKPAAVFIKPNILTYDITKNLINKIKASLDSPVILFGGVVSASPEMFINKDSLADIAILGEPEQTLKEILSKIESSSLLAGIPGTCYMENGGMVKEIARRYCTSLDELSFPRHEYFLSRKYSFLYPLALKQKMKFALMLTTRGCPFECAHCSSINTVSFGKQYRTRSIDNILREINYLRSKGVNTVYFCDDNFTADRQRVENICRALIENKADIYWAVQARADCLDDSLLSLMSKAGCRCINIGIESVSERIQKILNKEIASNKIEETALRAKALGIAVNADIIIGIPGETKNDILETLSFIKQINFNTITILNFIAYPGSKLYENYGNNYNIKDSSIYGFSAPGKREKALEKMRKYMYFKYYIRFNFIKMYLPGLLSFKNIGLQKNLILKYITYMLSW
jgi:radical SAM superfamily enzyme YgiQ (UPF0313 family)